jgi:hypothetical protein
MNNMSRLSECVELTGIEMKKTNEFSEFIIV